MPSDALMPLFSHSKKNASASTGKPALFRIWKAKRLARKADLHKNPVKGEKITVPVIKSRMALIEKGLELLREEERVIEGRKPGPRNQRKVLRLLTTETKLLTGLVKHQERIALITGAKHILTPDQRRNFEGLVQDYRQSADLSTGPEAKQGLIDVADAFEGFLKRDEAYRARKGKPLHRDEYIGYA